MSIKVMFVFGTRPEAIKMVPIIKKILEQKNNFDLKICVTAQHRNMLDQILNSFDLKPDYDLDIMKQSQSLSEITSKCLMGLENIFLKEKPDLILVHGDTTTTLAATLAAFYNKIKIGHVEAGLRTFNKFEPFPEEINRRLVSCMADLNFAPTSVAENNLLRDGVNKNNIFVTGNTAIDCIKYTVKKDYIFKNKDLNKIDYEKKKVIVVTAHRRENWGKPLKNICSAILELSKNKNLEFVYAVHPNPVVKNAVEKILAAHIFLIPPLDVFDMHNLISKSYLVLTDSGGLQEEAPSLNKPVLVLRNVTERPEGLTTGAIKLVGTEQKNIIKCVKELLSSKKTYEQMAGAKNPFGDGRASEKICDLILSRFGCLRE